MHEIAIRAARVSGAGAAFVSGSRAVGLGNAHSDLDVYVVHESGHSSREQVFTTEERLDVHHVSCAELEGAIGRVVGTRLLVRGPGSGQSIDHADVLLVAALSEGQVVLDDGRLRPLRDRLIADPLPIRRSVVNHWMSIGATCVEDWNGLRESTATDDLDAGLLVARSALIAGAKALLAAAGDLHFGRKWTWHQLSRTAPAGLPLSEFRHLGRVDPFADGHGAGTPEPMSLAATCLTVAGTAGWQGALTLPWAFWRLGEGPLRRNARYAIRSFDDGVVLMGPGTHHVCLKPDVALVWALCNGTSPDQVCAAAQEYRKTCESYGGLDKRRCESVIDQLRDAGLVIGTPEAAR